MPREVSLAEQMTEVTFSSVDAESNECAHHWMIDTPNGETSDGHCKRCGTTKAFFNYSQRKILTRSVKPAPAATTQVSV